MNKLLSEIHKTEKGVLNGVHYHFFYTDGSGTFSGTDENTGDIKKTSGRDSNWGVGCKKDPITDTKWCYMTKRNLSIFAYDNGKQLVSIGSDNFPGSSVFIRLDGDAPITSSAADGILPTATSTKVIERLKRAKSVTTRYVRWPYRSWVDDNWELYGFNEAFQYITWALKRIK